MIRVGSLDHRAKRRDLLRFGFFSVTALAATELVATIAPFIHVNRIVGLGETITLSQTKGEILKRFAETNDEPILFAQNRFFLLHAPGAIVAAYRKCTHLGCAVPFAKDEDRFHCPCHQSQYNKRTALLTSGPAPRGLDLFHTREVGGKIEVDTNPLRLLVRVDNKWHPEHIEVTDQA